MSLIQASWMNADHMFASSRISREHSATPKAPSTVTNTE